MHFERLKWLGVLAPVVFIGALELVHLALAPASLGGPGPWWFVTMAVLSAVWFYNRLMHHIGLRQRDLERRNRELLALHRAGLGIASELSLDTVLRKILDLARELLATRYAALAVYDEDDQLIQFITSGIDDRLAQIIGPRPTGKGLFKVVLEDGESLRLDDILGDSRVHGFPLHHPPMKRLLAVPVISRAAFRGNLYLADPLDDEPFSEEDKEILQRFASQAGIALDNAHIYARLEGLTLAEERLRLAREMHDGQAQVLAFVSTKAQAVREYLNRGKIEEAKVQLEQLAVAAREIYADVREGILGLRTIVDKDHTFGDVLSRFLERWEDQSGIRVELQLSALPDLPRDVELQLLRIIQETLANVRKHSAAERVSLELTCDDEHLRILIEDDGAGFDPDSPGRSRVPRFGLATMRERADAIGARLELTSRVGSGTRVEVLFPQQQDKNTTTIGGPETL